MRRQKGFAIKDLLGTLFIGFVWLAAFWGYVRNIIEIFSAIHEPATGLFIVRCFGVVIPPLGVVMGWFF